MIIGDGIVLGTGGETASIFVTGLRETDTVTASNGSKTLTGKWTQKPNPAYVALPNGYTQLEYIESTGTQYIDTGLYYDEDYIFTIKIAPTNMSGEMFTMGTNDGNGYSLAFSDTDEKYAMWRFVGNLYCISPSGFNIDYLREYILSKDGASSEGQVFTKNTQYPYSSGDKTILLFGTNTSTSSPKLSTCKISYFKVTKNDTIVQKLIPCKRNSDSAIGMYDLVSGNFFANSGTGTFTAGAEIPSTIEYWEFTIKQYGTYIVTANNEVTSKTQEVLIDSANVFYIEIRYDYFEFDFTKMTSLDELYTYFNTSAVGSISLTSDGLLATISSSAGNYASINLWPKTNLGSFSAVYGICKPISYSAECVTLYAGDGSYSAALRPMSSAFYYYTNSSTIQLISSFGTFTAGNTYSIGAKITEDHKQVLTKDGLSYTVSLPNTGGWPNLTGTIILAQCGTNNTTQVLWKKVIFSQRDYEVTL